MTRCEHCGQSTSTPVRIVTRTRLKTYPRRKDAHRFRRTIRGHRKWIERDDPGGKGWEIEHEGSFCPDCAGEIVVVRH